MRRTRVFVCECQPIVLAGLTNVLASSPDLELAGAALSLEEALAMAPAAAPDVILLCEDYDAPCDAHTLTALRSAAPQARLVLWTSAPDSHPAGLEACLSGVLDKRRPVSELLECLRAVAQGVRWMGGQGEPEAVSRRRSATRLTRRERDIVHLVAEGLKNREIAHTLAISAGTVKVHLMHIFEKAGVEDRLQLALLARRLLGQTAEEALPAQPEDAQRVVI